MTHDIINGGIAALATGSDDSDALVVNGVALGVNDVTEGMSGKRTRWPAEALEDAATLLEGKPITKQLGEKHVGAEKTDDGLSVSPNVPLEAKVGKVTQAKYEDGVGLMWQGEIRDPEMASKVEQGLAEVSPVLSRDVEPVDDDEGLYEATSINAVRDLGLVANGAAPSNSVQTGAAAMAADALAQAFDERAESREDSQEGDDAPNDQAADGGEEQSTGDKTDNSTMDIDDLSDEEIELLSKARQMDSATVIESEDAERLAEADELLADAEDVDDPVVVDSEAHEAMQDNVDTVRGVLEDALAERTDLREDTIEALSFDALAGEFENEEGEFDAEALVQSPETGGVSDDEEEEDAEFDAEALSADEREEINSLLARADNLEAVDPDYAESLREDAAELAGADDYEIITEEL